jgi:hypothetical protein
MTLFLTDFGLKCFYACKYLGVDFMITVKDLTTNTGHYKGGKV